MRPGAAPQHCRHRERGSVTPLIIGFAILLLMLCGVVVDASAAYLQRQSLHNLADGAALTGANEVRGAAVFEQGVGEGTVPLATDLAVAAVHDYLRTSGAMDRHPGLQVRVSVRRDAVVVSLRAPLDLPITIGDLTSGHVGTTGAAEVRVAD